MALTNEDLQAISYLLDTKIGSALQPITDEIREVKEDLKGVKTEVRELKEDFKGVKAEVRELKEDLKGVKADLEGVKAEVREMKVDFEGMKTEIQDLRDGLESVNVEVRKINLHLENVTDKNIQILAENYVPAAKRYESAAEEIMTIKSEQYVMKKVITKHSEMFQKISLAAT